MKPRLRLRRPSSTTSVIAVMVVLAAIGVAVLSLAGGSSHVSISSFEEPRVTSSEFASIAIGESRDRIEDRFGKGESALDYARFGTTGTALEPLDASCVYYGEGSSYSPNARVQLCFSHDKLVSKRRYPPAPS